MRPVWDKNVTIDSASFDEEDWYALVYAGAFEIELIAAGHSVADECALPHSFDYVANRTFILF